jgi:hypothetical protein
MASTLTQPILSLRASASVAQGSQPAMEIATITQTPTGITALMGGSGAGHVNTCISEAATITTGTPCTMNVVSGLDPLGNAAGMFRVTCVVVENNSVTTGQIITVGAGTHPVLGSDQFIVQPNGGTGCVCNPNPGYLVTGGSADVVTLTVAAGTAVPFKITIFGNNA